MIHRMTVLLSFVLGILGCSSDATTGSSRDEANGENANTETVFAFACDGNVSKLATFDRGLQPKCVDGPPGSKCGGTSETTCDAQDVHFSYEPPAMRCVGVDVFEWNGTECVAHDTHGDVDGESGMLRCTGKDCEHLFATKEACTEHANACRSK